MAVLYYASNVAILLIDLLLVNRLNLNESLSLHDYGDLIRGLMGAAIWIPYMIWSGRVKETFVHP